MIEDVARRVLALDGDATPGPWARLAVTDDLGDIAACAPWCGGEDAEEWAQADSDLIRAYRQDAPEMARALLSISEAVASERQEGEDLAACVVRVMGARVAVCVACGPSPTCDEDRCCLTCGRDLVVVESAHDADMIRELWIAQRDEDPGWRSMCHDVALTLGALRDRASTEPEDALPLAREVVAELEQLQDGRRSLLALLRQHGIREDGEPYQPLYAVTTAAATARDRLVTALGLPAAHVQDLPALVDRLVRERDELRLTLAAEQGRPEGAPSEGWANAGRSGQPYWLRAVEAPLGTWAITPNSDMEQRTNGGMAWRATFIDLDGARRTIHAPTARAAMLAADKASSSLQDAPPAQEPTAPAPTAPDAPQGPPEGSP